MSLVSSSRCIAAALVVAALAGCGTSAQQDACQGQKSGSKFTFNGAQQLAAQCISFSTGGQPPAIHIVSFGFEDGTKLELTVDMGQVAPAEIEWTSKPYPKLVNFKGFEGGAQSLCNSAESQESISGFVSGRLSLTHLSVGTNGFLDEIHGSLEAEFAGCTVAALGVSNGPVKLRGTF